MCLYISKHAKRQTATEDIKVFKVLERRGSDKFCSLYYSNTLWEKGQTLSARLDKPKYIHGMRSYAINRGLHSYAKFESACRLVRTIQYYNQDVHLIGMVIPKGSVYYVSADGAQYASSRLRWPACV